MSKISLTMIATVIATTMLTSCQKAKQPKDLFDEQQSGVCMVLNSYYYKIELPTGGTWYCSGIDSDGDLENLTLEEDEAKKNRSMATGTAFFIDGDGTLMTNRHVVNPSIKDDIIKDAATRVISQMKVYMQYCQTQYAQRYRELEAQKQYCYDIDLWGDYTFDSQRYYQIEDAQSQLEAEYYEAQDAIRMIDRLDPSKIKVTPITEIGIAYNNTYVTGKEDFLRNHPCVVTKVSNAEEIDLALIQLKDKKTPADKYIFKIKGRDVIPMPIEERLLSFFIPRPDDGIDVDKELIMIGFNAGMILGNTRQGIQAQMTTGKVTQKPDGTKILYSIPALQGSSGSPVIDTEGYVRAVNFSKLRGTDMFNFGIPDNLIMKFLNQ